MQYLRQGRCLRTERFPFASQNQPRMEAEHQKGQGCGQRNSQDRKRLLPLPSFRQDRARVNSIRYGIVSAFVRHFSFSGAAESVPDRMGGRGWRRFTLRIQTARVRIILRWWTKAESNVIWYACRRGRRWCDLRRLGARSARRELRYRRYAGVALPETARPEIWGVFAFCKINYVVKTT